MARDREHEYICREDGKIVTLTAPLGSSPQTPKCPVCKVPMAKSFGKPNVNYVRKWRISMGR